MSRVNILAGLAAVLTLGVAAVQPVQAQQATVFDGARIIVGDGSVIENGTIVVEGARISQAGAAASVKAPANATHVNLAGKTVMPMMLDTHTHLSTTRDALIRDLKQRAYWGVSAAMSLGTDNFDLLDVRSQVIPGAARYFSAGKGLSRPEGRPTLKINSVEDARKAVREDVSHKVDIIKVWVDDRDGKVQKVTPEMYAAAIDEAHKNGIRVTAHIFKQEDGKGLIRAGLDAFAHGVRDRDIDDEMVALYKSNPNMVVNPNLPDNGKKVDRTWLKPALPAAEYAKLEEENTDRPKVAEFHGIQARNLNRINKEGIKIVLGTDGNRAWSPHKEAFDMVSAGMTPMQVIMAATKNAAEFLRVADAGTVQAGKSADFIVLDANPAENITNTRKISSVYLRGAMVDRTHY